MKTNDIKVHEKIEDLEKFRKGNGNLIISLRRDNQITAEKIKKCAILSNTKHKCEEMARIYQSILNSYDEQSAALDRIFSIIKK
jgi:hypothetical protein